MSQKVDSNTVAIPLAGSPSSSPKKETSATKKQYADFQVVTKISESSYAVYLAFSKELKKCFALKVFPYRDNRISSGFVNETRFSWLSHKYIISFLDIIAEKKTFQQGKYFKTSYILMELAPYGDFLGLLNPDKLPYDERLARTYFHQLIDAVEYLHTNAVVHMDLKLENLLIGENFELKVTDFNLSCAEDEVEYCTEGTVNYRAPEILEGKCKDLKAADIYSAGVILFCLKSHLYPYLENPAPSETDFFKLLQKKDKSFWELHPKSQEDGKFFDKNFKELFMSMIERCPKKRATLKDVKKSAWFRGPTYTQQELVAIMKKYVQPKSYVKN
jgi:serine/threonine protein kinase